MNYREQSQIELPLNCKYVQILFYQLHVGIDKGSIALNNEQMHCPESANHWILISLCVCPERYVSLFMAYGISVSFPVKWSYLCKNIKEKFIITSLFPQESDCKKKEYWKQFLKVGLIVKDNIQKFLVLKFEFQSLDQVLDLNFKWLGTWTTDTLDLNL